MCRSSCSSVVPRLLSGSSWIFGMIHSDGWLFSSISCCSWSKNRWKSKCVQNSSEEVYCQENSTNSCDWVKGCSSFHWEVLKCHTWVQWSKNSMFVFDQPLWCLWIPFSIQVGFLEASSYCAIVRSFYTGIRMPDITVSFRGSPPNSPECRFGKVNENAACMGWLHKDPICRTGAAHCPPYRL